MSYVQKKLPAQRDKIDINFVQQKTDKDCVLACIAMVTGENYDDVMAACEGDSASPYEELCLLAHFQHLAVRQHDMLLFYDRCYLVSVASLNVVGGMHRIVVTTYDENIIVYDPNTNKEGKSVYNYDNLQTWTEVTEIIRCRD